MVYASIGIFCIFICTNICGMKRPRDQEQHDPELEKVFRQEIAKYRSSWMQIPEGLEPEKHGEIIQWDPQLRNAVTHFGGMYCHVKNEWKQIRAGEYTSQKEFFDSLYAENFIANAQAICPANVALHINRNKFPRFALDKATNTLMYPMYKQANLRRLFGISKSLHEGYHPTVPESYQYQYRFPTVLAFERDGKVFYQYDTQLNPKKDQISLVSCSHDGDYYAACSVQYENALNRYAIKVVKRLEDGTFGDEHDDVLTQGNDTKKKAFIFNISSRAQYQPHKIYFANNHLNFGIAVTDGEAHQHIISPRYGVSRYPCVVDCGEKQYESLGVTHRFSCLYAKLNCLKPSIHTTDAPRVLEIIAALEGQGLPKELRQKILYDLSYVDQALQSSSMFVYGADNTAFSEKEKKAFSVLNHFKKYVDGIEGFNGWDYNTWLAKKGDILKDFCTNGKYDEDTLWNAAQYGNFWVESSYSNKDIRFSRLLLKACFERLKFPPFKIIKSGLVDGEIIIDPEGKLSINHPVDIDGNRNPRCCFFRDSFYKEYDAQRIKAAGWGTRDHAQQFIDDKAVQEVIINDDAFEFIFNDGTNLPLKRHNDVRGWPRVINSPQAGIKRCWKSPHDPRTQEEAEAEWNAWNLAQ